MITQKLTNGHEPKVRDYDIYSGGGLDHIATVQATSAKDALKRFWGSARNRSLHQHRVSIRAIRSTR